MKPRLLSPCLFGTIFVLFAPCSLLVLAEDQDVGLIGHWKLQEDCRDCSGQGNHGINHGVIFDAAAAGGFDGADNYVEVPDSPSLALSKGDFSIALWVHTGEKLKDILGDIFSKYDPDARKGVNFGILNGVSVSTSQSNYRNLQFGIDAGKEGKWIDCGRPGNSKFIYAMAVFDGDLYVGTWEPGKGEMGHVYRYSGGTQWIDCGAPDLCNAVSSLGEHGGKLYAGSSLYSGRGSALPISSNKNPGGKVFRYEGGSKWSDCGKIDNVYTVTGLVSFDGELYATTCDSYDCPKPAKENSYRYEGGQKWTSIGSPGGRLAGMLVFNGDLYSAVFGGKTLGFARYDGGQQWTPLGSPPGMGQVYTAAIHQSRVLLATWPNAAVFRYDGPDEYTDLGRLGDEKETMAQCVYNGKLYGGTLPLGQVYRYDGPENWTCTGQLDKTPNVTYRRIWSMTVYQGKLFAGTLPSGHVYAMEAGKCVSSDRVLPPGWRHVTAVKAGGKLRLYVNGRCVAESDAFDPSEFDLANGQPLRIGLGEIDYFNGKMRDVRLYNRALKEAEIATLVKSR